MGFEEPNYTQTPNSLFDDLLGEMGFAEMKVVFAICRQTFGWHKREDKISLSQLQEMTSLSRKSVISGIQDAMERGIVGRREAGQSWAYRLIFDAEVNAVNAPEEATETTPEPSTQTGEGAPQPSAPEKPASREEAKHEREEERGWPLGRGITDAADHPAVQKHAEIFGEEAADSYSREKIALEVTKARDESVQGGKEPEDAIREVMQVWEETIDEWRSNQNRASSVGRQLRAFGERLQERRREEAQSESVGRQPAGFTPNGAGGSWGRAIC